MALGWCPGIDIYKISSQGFNVQSWLRIMGWFKQGSFSGAVVQKQQQRTGVLYKEEGRNGCGIVNQECQDIFYLSGSSHLRAICTIDRNVIKIPTYFTPYNNKHYHFLYVIWFICSILINSWNGNRTAILPFFSYLR